MLEILAIILLSNKNAKNAAARGRKPGGFRGMTLGLWFGGELIGFFIGMGMTNGETLPAYGFALLFAIMGGVASYAIAKSCKPGDHREMQHAPLAGAQPLGLPCELIITREKSFVGAVVTYSVYLNGQHMGDLKNGESIRVSAFLAQNVAVVKDAYGTELKPLYFTVPSGGSAQIVFGPQRFLPEKCGGIAVLDQAGIMYFAQNAPAYQAQYPQAQYPQAQYPQAQYPQAQYPQTQYPQTQYPQTQYPQTQYPQTQYPYAPYPQAMYPQQYAIPQVPAPPYLPENPARAVWVMGGALLFMLLGALLYLPWLGRSYDVTIALVSLSHPLLLGACVYLMLQSEGSYKAASGAGLLLGAVLHAFSITYLNIYASSMKAPPIGKLLELAQFTANLRTSLIIAAITGVVAVAVAFAHEGPGRQKLSAAAWTSMAAVALLGLFNLRNMFAIPNLTTIRKVGLVAANVGDALFIVLFALLVYMLCALGHRELNTGTGAKVWFGLCALFTTGNLVASIVTKTMGVAGAIVAAVGVTGYILLLASRRAGFPLVLLAVLMSVAAGISAGLLGYHPSVVNAVVPLVGLLNPLITWLVIRDSWSGLPQAMSRLAEPVRPGEKPRVNIAFKIGAVVNILLGGALFAAAAYSMADSGRFIKEAFLFGTVVGFVVAALGAVAAVQSFGRKSEARRWFLILQLVIACILLAVFAIGFISSAL